MQLAYFTTLASCKSQTRLLTSSFRTTHNVFALGYISLLNFMLIRCMVLKIWWFDFLFTYQNVTTLSRHNSTNQMCLLWHFKCAKFRINWFTFVEMASENHKFRCRFKAAFTPCCPATCCLQHIACCQLAGNMLLEATCCRQQATCCRVTCCPGVNAALEPATGHTVWPLTAVIKWKWHEEIALNKSVSYSSSICCNYSSFVDGELMCPYIKWPATE